MWIFISLTFNKVDRSESERNEKTFVHGKKNLVAVTKNFVTKKAKDLLSLLRFTSKVKCL